MAYSGAYQSQGAPETKPAAAPRPFFHAPSGGGTKLLADLMKKMKAIDLQSDDLLMLLILYLMYRESGDKQLLVMMGAMLLG